MLPAPAPYLLSLPPHRDYKLMIYLMILVHRTKTKGVWPSVENTSFANTCCVPQDIARSVADFYAGNLQKQISFNTVTTVP